jgi:flavin reductase (DIM6/NTAB) family NADH-FMN oxidoreductase RutF
MSDARMKRKVGHKVDLGAKVASYPMPVVLVGANVNGKANFLPIAWFMEAAGSPPKVAAALNRHITRTRA